MKGKRNFLIGIVLGALMAGSVTYYFMNKLYLDQVKSERNQLAQHEEIVESLKKNSLSYLLDNVLDKINEDLEHLPHRELSDETIDRIAAMCYFFKPYYHPVGDTILVKKISPERGQLLLLLAGMNIDSVSFYRIKMKASFSDADLRGADLRGKDLSGAVLSRSDFQDANLQGAKLNKADLSFANLWGANLNKAILSEANLNRANLAWANLNETNFANADLHEADLSSAQMRKTDLRKANIKWADLSGAFLKEANLDSADLFRTSLVRAQLSGSNLTKANLSLTNMTDANLNGTTVTDAILTDAVVTDSNWLIRLNEWLVTGAEEMQSRYKLVKENFNGQPIYRFKKL